MIILESDPWSKFFFLGRVLLFSIWSCFRWIRRLFQFNFSCQNILNPLLKMAKFSFLAFLLEPGTFALVKKRSSFSGNPALPLPFYTGFFFCILHIHIYISNTSPIWLLAITPLRVLGLTSPICDHWKIFLGSKIYKFYRILLFKAGSIRKWLDIMPVFLSKKTW